MAKKKPIKKQKIVKLEKVARKSYINQKNGLILIVFVATVLIAVSGWLWWTKILINPDRVLDDAIAKSLQTSSITRQVSQDDGSQKVNQLSYLSFYAPTVTAETTTKLTQKGLQRQETTITTDTIGTKGADYVKYSAVDGAENLPGAENFQKLLGIWAKKQSSQQEGQQASFLSESLFSIVPIGNLDPSSREQLLELIDNKKLYNYKSVERKVENYRPVYKYTLEIKPADLIEVLAKYAHLTGATDPAQFNPEAYANAPNVTIEATVDIASRQIIKIQYGDANRTEVYSSYNLYRPIKLPENTISIDELQNKLQQPDQNESS